MYQAVSLGLVESKSIYRTDCSYWRKPIAGLRDAFSGQILASTTANQVDVNWRLGVKPHAYLPGMVPDERWREFDTVVRR